MHKPKPEMNTIYFDGIAVGEAPVTGDHDKDIDEIRRVLKEKGLHRPKSRFEATFNQAVVFASTASVLYEQGLLRKPYNPATIAPFVVNASFSIEIYLKALAQKYGVTLHGHELLKLYKKLPKAAIEEIEKVTPECAARRNLGEVPDFIGYLRELNNTFVQWRYCFESDRTGQVRVQQTIFVLDVLHRACRLHPASAS